jgi:transposase
MESVMAWTEITRPKYRRDGLRYASDTTDEEWAVVAPRLPAAHRRGRPRETSLRRVVNAIFYIAQSGCHWRMLPKDFPPFTTVQYYFYCWRDDGTWLAINHALVMQAREMEGRDASPTAGVIDSQSVKTTEAAGPHGYDAGKKINGRKRHLLVDTLGLLIAAIVHRADIQDRDGAPLLLAAMRSAFPWLRHIFADAAYAGGKLQQALAKLGTWTFEIIRRSDSAKGFVQLPRRWGP